jgi:hypothetical protein
VGFRRRRRGRGAQAWVEGLHIEGEVVCLRTGEGGGAIDGEEFFEEAVALAALDVAAAAAGVEVGVQRHLREMFFCCGGGIGGSAAMELGGLVGVGLD